MYPRYGDIQGSWAPRAIGNREFLEVWPCMLTKTLFLYSSVIKIFRLLSYFYHCIVGIQSRALHQEHFDLWDIQFWCCSKYQRMEFTNTNLSVCVSRWSWGFDIQQDLFTADWGKITYVIQISFSALVISATHSIYVWCFLLQCHLEKRTLRIFGGGR